jgi:hypothetical protein
VEHSGLMASQLSFLSRRNHMKADEGAVACRVEAERRLKDGGEQGVQFGGGPPRAFVYGCLGLQALHALTGL